MYFKRSVLLVVAAGLFILDQWLKWQALHEWHEKMLLGRFFGWYPFLNPGVAFGIPLPIPLITLLTIPVVAFLLVRWWRTRSRGVFWEEVGLAAIVTGAVSNLLDRVVYGVTVDYGLFFTAVINVADVLIVLGFMLYFLTSERKPTSL